MQASFIFTQSRKLHNDSVWKKKPESNSSCSHLYP